MRLGASLCCRNLATFCPILQTDHTDGLRSIGLLPDRRFPEARRRLPQGRDRSAQEREPLWRAPPGVTLSRAGICGCLPRLTGLRCDGTDLHVGTSRNELPAWMILRPRAEGEL